VIPLIPCVVLILALFYYMCFYEPTRLVKQQSSSETDLSELSARRKAIKARRMEIIPAQISQLDVSSSQVPQVDL
jgi:hypothetical protein